MLFRSTRLADRSLQGDSLRARLLRIEQLEDRRLLTARATEAVNLFALDVYEQLQREQGNLFYSPLSISAALAMTYAGAAGQTAAEMEQVLHLGTEPGIHASFDALFSSFDFKSATIDDYEILLANAIWPQLGLPLQSSFVNTIETDYRGHAQGVDFANPEQAEDIINAWVEAQTQGRIQDLVDGLGPDTAMVLTNSIYFKGLWDSPFDPRHTESGWFSFNEDDGIYTPMMNTQMDAAMTRIDGFDVLDLPLADGTASMVFILPTQYDGSNYLTSEVLMGIEDWFDGPRQILEGISVLLPKFQTTVDTSLNQLLIGLGMPSAFGDADFSQMTDAGVFIDKVFHKAFIEVNEQGTEAAAATEVELVACFAAGTPVLTPEGEKPIELLNVGDFVLARDEHNSEGDLQSKVVQEARRGHADILELHVRGRIIRTTELHPFFVQGRGWTPAGKLKVKDRLSTNLLDWVEVEKVVETGSTEPVYNLRVADHHTYFVGSKTWKFAIWTHNYYDGEFYATHPFHFIIRDNATSTITFMGRIDDPSQLQNSVDPTFQQNPTERGDFNNDNQVDGDDYDVWKAAFGQTGNGLPADGSGNGVVDIADYTRWRDNLGTSLAPPSAAGNSHNGPLATALAPEALLPISSSERQKASLNKGRLPLAPSLVQVSDDDLLLLALTTVSRPTAAETANPIPLLEATDYQSSVDEALAVLGIEVDLWKRAALGM